MKLIVHAGTHKTATTSFQRLCYNNFENLIASKVLYPKYRNWKQHSYLAWQFQSQNKPVISDFFRGLLDATEALGCKTAIISGEDFENSLIDHTMANELENNARLAGFNEIEWIFVRRQPSQYLKAIYGELSKQRIYGNVVLDVAVMAHCIKHHGYFSCASKNYNHKFIFDFEKFIPQFKSKVSSNLTLIDFDEFKKNYLGSCVFKNILNINSFKSMKAHAEKQKPINVSDQLSDVEYRYALNYFNIQYRHGLNSDLKKFILQVASERTQKSAELLEKFRTEQHYVEDLSAPHFLK